MAADENSESSVSDERLSLLYEGGLADNGALLLPEYAASLDGWRDLFQLLGELYFHSFPELRKVRGSNLLRIEVVAERRGSYETVLVFVLGVAAGGIIGNRADAAVVWSFRKLVEWYRQAVTTYVLKKSQTTDFTEIAAALESMTAEQGISLESEAVTSDEQPLFEDAKNEEVADEATPPKDTSVDKASVLTERLDQALKQATQPLEHSCERVKLFISSTEILLEIGPAERGIIASPLTAPPPKRDWRSAKIKFERTSTARQEKPCSILSMRMTRMPRITATLSTPTCGSRTIDTHKPSMTMSFSKSGSGRRIRKRDD
jgi:hypothetical protein